MLTKILVTFFLFHRDTNSPTNFKKQILSESFEERTDGVANRQNFLSICVSLIFIGSFVYAVFSFNNSLHENFKRNGKYESIEFAHQKAMDKIVVESEKVMGINEYQCGFECQKQKITDHLDSKIGLVGCGPGEINLFVSKSEHSK